MVGGKKWGGWDRDHEIVNMERFLCVLEPEVLFCPHGIYISHSSNAVELINGG